MGSMLEKFCFLLFDHAAECCHNNLADADESFHILMVNSSPTEHVPVIEVASPPRLVLNPCTNLHGLYGTS